MQGQGGHQDRPKEDHRRHARPAPDRARRAAEPFGVENRGQVVSEQRPLEHQEDRDGLRPRDQVQGGSRVSCDPDREADHDPDDDDGGQGQEHPAPAPPQGRLPQAGQEERERGGKPCDAGTGHGDWRLPAPADLSLARSGRAT